MTMSRMSTSESFVRWNMQVSDRLTPAVEHRTHPYPRFDQLVADYLNSHDNVTLVDIGAGRHCDYSERVVKRPQWVVGVDIAADELALNPFLDQKIAASACDPLPILEGKADLLVSKATLEHLPDNSKVIIDGSNSTFIDYDVLEAIQDFKLTAHERNITGKMIDVPEVAASAAH